MVHEVRSTSYEPELFTSKNMIEIKNLVKNFDDQKILKGVNLTVKTGEICALIGSSGKGKSVLLKHIIGLLRPDGGQVLINNLNIHHLKGSDLKGIKERLGIVFQGSALFDSLNVYENVAFPVKEKTNLKPYAIRKKVLKALDDVGLRKDRNKFPSQISGGMKKRVALARCLITHPEIILFDEPTTGLDPMTTNTIHALIRSLQKKNNLTAIIVSHEIPNIFSIVDQVAMLHNGSIVESGTPQKIKNSDNSIVQKFLHGELDN